MKNANKYMKDNSYLNWRERCEDMIDQRSYTYTNQL